MNRSVFVVLPVFNEARVVASALAPLLDRGYTVVAVDDGSTDDTWQIIRPLPIHSLRHPVNLGQGAALQTGMTYALEHDAEYIVHFDADGQHRVDDIDVLRAALGYERITVLTHSFGTLLGLEYAARYPENLRALILMNPVEPGSRFGDETGARQRAARTPDDARELDRLTSGEAFLARDPATLSQVFRLSFRSALHNPDRVAELSLDLLPSTAKNGQDVAALLGASLGTVDWWDRLSAIETPSLILHGRFDLPPVGMSRALAEALPRGSLVVLDSGHFPYLEDSQPIQYQQPYLDVQRSLSCDILSLIHDNPKKLE